MRKTTRLATIWLAIVVLTLTLTLISCGGGDDDARPDVSGPVHATVLSVEANGEPFAYSFTVVVSSPDTGCERYADWWEILSESGVLLYRRVLLHSHATEQPIVRSGGPVDIDSTDTVIVRAHMNSTGYGEQSLRGSADSGFTAFTMPEGFAADVEMQEPQPDGCEF